MLSIVTPHLRLNSVFELTPEWFCSLARPALLLDVDCTLKNHGAKSFDAPVVNWLASMRDVGALPCLLSNGRVERIQGLASSLDVPFVAKAFKPLPFGCHAALRTLGVRADQAMIIGDQIFADVMAGRLAGIFSILVRPTSPEEPWFTRIKRPFERVILKRLPPVTVPKVDVSVVETAGILNWSKE